MATKKKKKSTVKPGPAFGILKKVKMQDVVKAEELLEMMVHAGRYTGATGTCCPASHNCTRDSFACTDNC